jgi:glycosyltransferase involved in cell wall biosynthesis
MGSATSALQAVGWQRAIFEFDQLIVHSSASRQTLVEWGYPGERVNVVAHGLLEFKGVDPDSESRDQKVILLFGNIKEYKGPDLLIEAFGRLTKEERGEWKIRFAGQAGMPMEPLFSRVRELGLEGAVEFDLRFLPEEELAQQVRDAGLLAFPYREIDASGAFFGALRYGRPIVASRIGVFERMIRDRETGFLVEPQNVDSLAQGLREVITNNGLRQSLANGARILARETDSWPEIARKTVTVYEKARLARFPA